MSLITEVLGSAGADPARPATESLRRIARGLGWLLLVAGVAVFGGWLLQVDSLGRVVPSSMSMKANTALGFVVLGLLLLVATHAGASRSQERLRILRVSFAAVVVLLGVAHWAEHILRIDLGIDQLLAPDLSPDTPHAGRMAESSAISFALIGSAILLMDSQRTVLQAAAQGLALTVFAIAYVGIMGYLFDAGPLYRTGSRAAMSVQAAVLFEMASVGLLLARADRGITRVVASDCARGVLLRRLVPAVLVIAPLIGWLHVEASQHSGSIDAALVALANVVTLVLLVYGAANAMQAVVSARDRAEATARASAERLNWALQAAGGGAWDWDLLKNQAWWSAEMYELWRVDSATSMHFENSMQWIDPRDREQVATAVARALDERTMYRCEFRIGDAGGPERWMESRGRATYDDAGRAIRLLGISIDISTQKQIELSLRRANETLERRNEELQRFAYVASHDLQTPLRTIASYAELLQAQYSIALPPQAALWLRRIVFSAENLQALVRDLLQYSRVGSSAAPFVAVSMEQVVERVIGMLEGPIRECRAVVTQSPLPAVKGDATQLAELLLNLIDNALKYRSGDAPIVHISAHMLEHQWQFCVADNGIGIEERHFDRIFAMFERLHNASEYTGTGIGLAICRSIVQRHGGHIWVQSQPGKGSQFFFSMPRPASDSPGEDP